MLSGGLKKLSGKSRGGGLSVCAAYADELCSAVAASVAKLYLAYYLRTVVSCLLDEGAEYRHHGA